MKPCPGGCAHSRQKGGWTMVRLSSKQILLAVAALLSLAAGHGAAQMVYLAPAPTVAYYSAPTLAYTSSAVGYAAPVGVAYAAPRRVAYAAPPSAYYASRVVTYAAPAPV